MTIVLPFAHFGDKTITVTITIAMATIAASPKSKPIEIPTICPTSRPRNRKHNSFLHNEKINFIPPEGGVDGGMVVEEGSNTTDVDVDSV